jgi:hypothetical protein
VDNDERAVQLYTLEYQKAAERYDNIYRSIWTIFSYMTVVAGGFLAFGADRIEPHALICIASIPLLFWLLTTYLPLDRYGTQVIKRLGQIECILSRDYHVELDHFKRYANKELSVCKGLWRALRARNRQCVWDQVRRARFAIGLIFVILIVLVVFSYVGFRHSGEKLFLAGSHAPVPTMSKDSSTTLR